MSSANPSTRRSSRKRTKERDLDNGGWIEVQPLSSSASRKKSGNKKSSPTKGNKPPSRPRPQTSTRKQQTAQKQTKKCSSSSSSSKPAPLLASPSSPVREGYSYAESVKAKVDNNNKFVSSGVAAASPPIINEHDEEKNVAQGTDVNANHNQVEGKDKISKDIESPNKEEDFATDLTIDHLAICNSKSPPLNIDSGSESESDISVGEEQHDFPKAQLRPGDVILFFDGAHHLRWENLRWATVTSINTYHTTVDGIDAPVKCANIGLEMLTLAIPTTKLQFIVMMAIICCRM